MFNLRILSGLYRGQKIQFSPKNNCKVIMNRVRMNIFDILYNYVEHNFSFLDVFAGSGIMSMEALSRGAQRVILFEINKKFITLLKKNFLRLKLNKDNHNTYYIINTNSLKPPLGQPVQVIFLDPPYIQSYIISDVINKLLKGNWINRETLLISKTLHNETYKIPENFYLYKNKKIGKHLINFIKYQPEMINNSIM